VIAVRRAGVVLAVLVIAAAAALVWLVREGSPGTTPVTSAESADATVASQAVKQEVREVAAEAATRAYSYSWKTLVEDKARARALMTTAMQARYDRTMAGTGTTGQRERTVVWVEVVDTALVTATPTGARVLVFVNRRTTGRGLEEPLLDLDRVLVSLEDVDGEWKVSGLDAL
jgi:Mce-associated membrane protein